MRGRKHDEQASGTMPSRPKTKPMRAFVEASRRSMASVIVAPMPTAGPLIAAITGLGHAWIASATLPPVSRTPSWYGASVRWSRRSAGVGSAVSSRPNTLPSAERSMPAQKARPAPVTTIARIASSVAAAAEEVLELAGHGDGERVERVRPVQGQRADAVVVGRHRQGVVARRRRGHPRGIPLGVHRLSGIPDVSSSRM